MDSYYASIRSKCVLSETHLPQTPSLEDQDAAEAEMMRKLASFVGDSPVPSAHYMKPTIASVQCLTSFCEKSLPSGKVDKIMTVGLGFAFAPDLLFTARHLSREKKTWNTTLPAYTYQTRPALPYFSILLSLWESTVLSILLFCRHYPSDRRFTSCCDVISEDGLAGGPVVNSRGRVLGMFKGTLGAVERGFITSEGLARALNFIQKDWTFKEWGIKSVISEKSLRIPRGVGRSNAEKITLPEDQEECAPRDANPPKEHEVQLFQKRAAPENDDDFQLRTRKAIKPDRSTSIEKELRFQSSNSTVLNKEKSWHPKKLLPSMLTYKLL